VQVSNAEKCGARGVLLYNKATHTSVPVWAAPHDTVLATSGDPTTPQLPSLGTHSVVPHCVVHIKTMTLHIAQCNCMLSDGVFRLPLARVTLPTIPVQTVSVEQAEQLLAYMTGPRGSSTFDNCLSYNVTCQLGPGFRSPRHDM
jgi:hypothetical protein